MRSGCLFLAVFSLLRVALSNSTFPTFPASYRSVVSVAYGAQGFSLDYNETYNSNAGLLVAGNVFGLPTQQWTMSNGNQSVNTTYVTPGGCYSAPSWNSQPSVLNILSRFGFNSSMFTYVGVTTAARNIPCDVFTAVGTQTFSPRNSPSNLTMTSTCNYYFTSPELLPSYGRIPVKAELTGTLVNSSTGLVVQNFSSAISWINFQANVNNTADFVNAPNASTVTSTCTPGQPP